ncbi:MAG: stage II sporulation protein M [Bryobacteraceae bacterium]|nr:stage II sporulation protein M [Bryobacteraceae bacterium]
MIVDLERFVNRERPYWQELERVLTRLDDDPERVLALDEALRLHYLYQRGGAGLTKLNALPGETALRGYLESLVARAYGQIHETRGGSWKSNVWRWFTVTFPQAFRRRHREFALSAGLLFLGAAFGAFALKVDPSAKDALVGFGHLKQTPAERVAGEEKSQKEGDRLAGRKTSFSAELMTHNTRVAIFTCAMGMTWGFGTAVSLFYNGVILGAVGYDYIHAGYARFLFGWLLPHGSVEIPAILLGGQGGFVLAGALIRRRERRRLAERLRQVTPDVLHLLGGVAILLVWAGIVEAFFSQYHEPILPYDLKIAVGLLELVCLFLFLTRAGRHARD